MEKRNSRTQTLHWHNGYAVVTPLNASTAAGTTLWDDRAISLATPSTSTPHDLAGLQSIDDRVVDCQSQSVGDNQPPWLRYHNQVLRFFAYFTEEVPYSQEESKRHRRVHILHYLEDSTTQIIEPRRGDGILQGVLVKRSRIIDAQSLQDLIVGRTISIHGRSYRLVDADPFTREFFASRGVVQPEAIPIPQDDIDAFRALKSKPSGLSTLDPESPTRFAEVLLGRTFTKKLQKFLQGNSVVLQFFAIWDDEKQKQPTKEYLGIKSKTAQCCTRRYFKILFYLEDDTLEIGEIAPPDSSHQKTTEQCTSYGKFLCRAQFPSRTKDGGTLQPEDLRIGSTLDVYGREFFIHSCDGYTRQWMLENCNRTEVEMQSIDVSVPPPPPFAPPLPPHNGFGDPEDTERNCRRLIPVAPKSASRRALRHQRDGEEEVLVFHARFDESSTASQHVSLPSLIPTKATQRHFTISFYPSDGTLSIYEPPVPNSGISGGKFLDRCVACKNSVGSNDRVTQTDLYPGAVVNIHGFRFELYEK